MCLVELVFFRGPCGLAALKERFFSCEAIILDDACIFRKWRLVALRRKYLIHPLNFLLVLLCKLWINQVDYPLQRRIIYTSRDRFSSKFSLAPGALAALRRVTLEVLEDTAFAETAEALVDRVGVAEKA